MTEWRCHTCNLLLARVLTKGESPLVEIRCRRCGKVNYFGGKAEKPLDRPADAGKMMVTTPSARERHSAFRRTAKGLG